MSPAPSIPDTVPDITLVSLPSLGTTHPALAADGRPSFPAPILNVNDYRPIQCKECMLLSFGYCSLGNDCSDLLCPICAENPIECQQCGEVVCLEDFPEESKCDLCAIHIGPCQACLYAEGDLSVCFPETFRCQCGVTLCVICTTDQAAGCDNCGECYCPECAEWLMTASCSRCDQSDDSRHLCQECLDQEWCADCRKTEKEEREIEDRETGYRF